MLTVFLFSASKLEVLVKRKQPMINKYENEEALTVEDVFDTNNVKFAMAFGLIELMTGLPKHDPRYIRWYAVYWKTIGDVLERNLIPMYPCKKEDLDKFNPPATKTHNTYDYLK